MDTLIVQCRRMKMRKKQYINRHRSNKNWNDPMSAGTLSRYILWEHPLLSTAINNYIKMFRLKKYWLIRFYKYIIV